MKRKSNISLAFLIIACLLATVTLGLLIFDQGAKVFDDVSFYVICGALFSLIIAVIVSLLNHKNQHYVETLEKRLELWNTISYKVKGAGETAFKDFPIGVVVLNSEYQVKWSNEIVQKMLMSNLKEKNLKEIANGKIYNFIIDIEEEEKEEDVIKDEIELFKKIYEITFIKSLRVIYLSEVTQFVDLKNQYTNRTLALGYINIDNLEEALSDFDVQERAEYQGKIMACIGEWANEFGFFIRAYNDTRYMIVMNQEQLRNVMSTNFTILDDVKVLLRTTKLIRITLSIGISCCDIDMKSLNADAQAQLELALTRGGDQAVVKIDDKVHFFGAKTDPIIKTSKVDIRNKSQELQDLMRSSSIVFAIGHRGLDADGFAATLAIYRLATSLGKEAYIATEPKGSSLGKFWNILSIDNDYSSVILDLESALYSRLNRKEQPNELCNI